MTASKPPMAVFLTAWRRPYYFEPVLESWAAADGIGDVSRLVIGLGPTDRCDAQMALIERMRPAFPCPVEVVMQSPAAVAAPSAHRAIAEGISGVFADGVTDFVVFGEEDILVSSDVLAYVSWARDRFENDAQVLCVCAHNQGGSGWDPPVPPEEADADQRAVRLLPYFSGWVNGFWRDRWEKTLLPNWDWDATSGSRGFDSGWDWAIQMRLIPSGGYLCVVPDASRSQNTGQYEGGYADPARFRETVSGSFRLTREPGYELVAA
jgi:hypothetical protein